MKKTITIYNPTNIDGIEKIIGKPTWKDEEYVDPIDWVQEQQDQRDLADGAYEYLIMGMFERRKYLDIGEGETIKERIKIFSNKMWWTFLKLIGLLQ
jgi:hypothetical protein